MATLIEQLQTEALESEVSLTDLLRKTKLCAAKLGLRGAVEWVEHELSGYPAGIELPAYRQLIGSAQYRTFFGRWVPLRFDDAHMNELLSKTMLGHSIPEIEQLLTYRHPIVTYLPEQVEQLRGLIPVAFTDAGTEVGKSALVGLLNAVRSRVCDWAVELETAGVRGEGHLSFSKSDKEAASQVTYNITIGGSVTGTVGAVSGHAAVTATHIGSETIQSLRSLAEQIEQRANQMGLSPTQRDELVSHAVELKKEATRTAPESSRLGKTLASIKQVVENAAGNLLASGVLHVLARPDVAALLMRVAQ